MLTKACRATTLRGKDAVLSNGGEAPTAGAPLALGAKRPEDLLSSVCPEL